MIRRGRRREESPSSSSSHDETNEDGTIPNDINENKKRKLKTAHGHRSSSRSHSNSHCSPSSSPSPLLSTYISLFNLFLSILFHIILWLYPILFVGFLSSPQLFSLHQHVGNELQGKSGIMVERDFFSLGVISLMCFILSVFFSYYKQYSLLIPSLTLSPSSLLLLPLSSFSLHYLSLLLWHFEYCWEDNIPFTHHIFQVDIWSDVMKCNVMSMIYICGWWGVEEMMVWGTKMMEGKGRGKKEKYYISHQKGENQSNKYGDKNNHNINNNNNNNNISHKSNIISPTRTSPSHHHHSHHPNLHMISTRHLADIHPLSHFNTHSNINTDTNTATPCIPLHCPSSSSLLLSSPFSPLSSPSPSLCSSSSSFPSLFSPTSPLHISDLYYCLSKIRHISPSFTSMFSVMSAISSTLQFLPLLTPASPIWTSSSSSSSPFSCPLSLRIKAVGTMMVVLGLVVRCVGIAMELSDSQNRNGDDQNAMSDNVGNVGKAGGREKIMEIVSWLNDIGCIVKLIGNSYFAPRIQIR